MSTFDPVVAIYLKRNSEKYGEHFCLVCSDDYGYAGKELRLSEMPSYRTCSRLDCNKDFLRQYFRFQVGTAVDDQCGYDKSMIWPNRSENLRQAFEDYATFWDFALAAHVRQDKHILEVVAIEQGGYYQCLERLGFENELKAIDEAYAKVAEPIGYKLAA
jgi:hypothetical protein